MTPWRTLKSTAAGVIVTALAACHQPASPFQPSPTTSLTVAHGATLINPNQGKAIANAIGNCKGPYNDIDGSGSLSCGDEVTSVDALDCPFD